MKTLTGELWMQTMSVTRKKQIYDVCVKYGQYTPPEISDSRLSDGVPRRDNCRG
jgi:hypothetical protein